MRDDAAMDCRPTYEVRDLCVLDLEYLLCHGEHPDFPWLVAAAVN